MLEKPGQYNGEMVQWGSLQLVAFRVENTVPAEIRKENKTWQEKPKEHDAINLGSCCLSCHSLCSWMRIVTE